LICVKSQIINKILKFDCPTTNYEQILKFDYLTTNIKNLIVLLHLKKLIVLILIIF